MIRQAFVDSPVVDLTRRRTSEFEQDHIRMPRRAQEAHQAWTQAARNNPMQTPGLYLFDVAPDDETRALEAEQGSRSFEQQSLGLPGLSAGGGQKAMSTLNGTVEIPFNGLVLEVPTPPATRGEDTSIVETLAIVRMAKRTLMDLGSPANIEEAPPLGISIDIRSEIPKNSVYLVSDGRTITTFFNLKEPLQMAVKLCDSCENYDPDEEKCKKALTPTDDCRTYYPINDETPS